MKNLQSNELITSHIILNIVRDPYAHTFLMKEYNI